MRVSSVNLKSHYVDYNKKVDRIGVTRQRATLEVILLCAQSTGHTPVGN